MIYTITSFTGLGLYSVIPIAAVQTISNGTGIGTSVVPAIFSIIWLLDNFKS